MFLCSGKLVFLLFFSEDADNLSLELYIGAGVGRMKVITK